MKKLKILLFITVLLSAHLLSSKSKMSLTQANQRVSRIAGYSSDEVIVKFKKDVPDEIILLTWIDNANNETGFVIERCQEGTGIWDEIVTPGANSNEYWDNLTQAGTFYYRIKALNPLGFSSFSNQLTVVVEAY